MSVIFGLFYRNGKPVTNELDSMYAGMQHFPHESHRMISQGNCGFGHMLTYNTPEAVHESMPKRVDAARLLFIAEGRLDNRDDLFQALAVPSCEQTDMPDGDLMLQAYLKWGETCADRLMGKWSLAAFHTDQQTLFIARDKWDYTAVDYDMDGDVIAFSTSSKGLLPLPFIKKEIDEVMIARLLTVWQGDFDKSYIKGILHLQPSHTLHVSREREALRRYWNYENIPLRRGLTLEDYVEDLFGNLKKAVTARLRSYRPVASMLSGGLDSSTVSVLAAEQLAQQGKRLLTYSHVPQFTPSLSLSKNQFGDEHPYIEATVAAAGTIDPVFLTSAETSPLEGIRNIVHASGMPFHGACNAYWLNDICVSAVKDHCGTLLTGEFGNATTSWKGMVDALPAGVLLRRYGAEGLFKRKVIIPILYGNTPLAPIYKRITCGKRPWKKISYCTEAFEDSLKLRKRIKASGFDPSFRYYYRNPKNQAVQILNLNVLRLTFGVYIGCEMGLELRDPTGDPRVIESAFAIPNEMFIGEMNKWVLRTMMKGRLPDEVRLNTRGGKQSADLVARLCAYPDEMNRILADMEAYGFGRIVDIGRMRAEWMKMKADIENYPVNAAAHLLRMISAFEFYRML